MRTLQHIPFSIPALFLLLFISQGFSALPSPGLETEKISKLYMDGEFASASKLLEDYLNSHNNFSREDSIFVFKHLGVMYCANEETREKGKYYMYKLLEVSPTAKILDMFASDMIYMIFKNVREEFQERSKNQDVNDRFVEKLPNNTGLEENKAGNSSQAPLTSKSSSKSKGKSKVAIIAIASGAAVVGVLAAVLIFSDDSQVKETTIKVSDNANQ